MENLTTFEKWLYYPVTFAWTIFAFNLLVGAETPTHWLYTIEVALVAVSFWAMPKTKGKVQTGMRVLLCISGAGLIVWGILALMWIVGS